MVLRESYKPGTFCCTDLASTDASAARDFYSELFGWEAESIQGADGGDYTMMTFDGDEACAIYQLEDERFDDGVRSHWSSYVSVEDADEAISRAEEAGGAVVSAARDVMDMGRMCVISDPTKANFAAWEPQSWAGASRVNDPGFLSWNELQTSNLEEAAIF